VWRAGGEDGLNTRCTLHTLHTAHCTLHCTLHTAHCTYCTLHTAHCTAHCTLHTLHTAHCTLHTAHCTAHCTLHTAHCTAHCTLHTLHCTLHPFPGHRYNPQLTSALHTGPGIATRCNAFLYRCTRMGDNYRDATRRDATSFSSWFTCRLALFSRGLDDRVGLGGMPCHGFKRSPTRFGIFVRGAELFRSSARPAHPGRDWDGAARRNVYLLQTTQCDVSPLCTP
jgi:hypothetical protein